MKIKLMFILLFATGMVAFIHGATISPNEPILNVTDLIQNYPAFYGYRVSSYNVLNTTIPYDGVIFDTRKALNLETGEYKVPVKGTYYIYFSGMKLFVEPILTLSLLHNNKVISVKKVRQHRTDSTGPGANWIPIFIEASLNLEVGDIVSVQLNTGGIYDSDQEGRPIRRTTSFVGYLVKPF